MNFDIEYIEKLAKLLDDNQLYEVTLEDGDKAITLKKGSGAPVMMQTLPPAITAASTESLLTSKEVCVDKPKGTAVTSPMVGAYYASPSPASEAYVKVGDTVKTGQVVCIVEAMKLMNEIETEVSGKITQICVEDGQSVEYGQVLMYVE